MVAQLVEAGVDIDSRVLILAMGLSVLVSRHGAQKTPFEVMEETPMPVNPRCIPFLRAFHEGISLSLSLSLSLSRYIAIYIYI